jgi:hypothetical protein
MVAWIRKGKIVAPSEMVCSGAGVAGIVTSNESPLHIEE